MKNNLTLTNSEKMLKYHQIDLKKAGLLLRNSKKYSNCERHKKKIKKICNLIQKKKKS